MSGYQPGLQIPFVSNKHLKFPEAQQMSIRVDSWSNGVRIIAIRGMTGNALLSHDHSTNGDRSQGTSTFRVDDVPVFLRANNTLQDAKRGECYVRVTLQMGGFDVGILCAGYISNDTFLSYPLGRLEGPVLGPGVIRTIAMGNPAAGAELSMTVPTNTRWRLLMLNATLASDITVATRQPSLLFTDGTNILGRVVSVNTGTATSTVMFTWTGLGINAAVASVVNSQSIPDFVYLNGGSVISSVTTNLQAGDDWGAGFALVEEWLEE